MTPEQRKALENIVEYYERNKVEEAECLRALLDESEEVSEPDHGTHVLVQRLAERARALENAYTDQNLFLYRSAEREILRYIESLRSRMDKVVAAPPPTSTNKPTDWQMGTLIRLAMILEAGQAENGIDHARAQTYAEALRALLAATEAK